MVLVCDYYFSLVHYDVVAVVTANSHIEGGGSPARWLVGGGGENVCIQLGYVGAVY